MFASDGFVISEGRKDYGDDISYFLDMDSWIGCVKSEGIRI